MNHPAPPATPAKPAAPSRPASRTPRQSTTALLGLATAALVACAGTPPPDWQLNTHGALQRAVQAQLSGHERVATAEFQVARAELARTGQPALLARAELLRCAAAAASLQFGPCAGFEPLRGDADPTDQAYADHLRGRLPAEQRGSLPAAQQALAAPPDGGAADLARLQAVADPLSRLLGAALWLQAGQASPAVVALAVDTASQQGWRRPLLAWLQLQQALAERAGQTDEAARIQRRIALVLGGPSTP